MKLFKGSHSIAMGWAMLVLSAVLSFFLKDITPFVVALPIAGGLVANKTYQVRKEKV